MNDAQLLARLVAVDEFRDDTALPEAMRSDVVLREIERRMQMDLKELNRPQPLQPEKRNRWGKGPLAAAITFAAAVVVVGVVLAIRPGGGDGPVLTTPPESTTTTATTEPTTAPPSEPTTAPSSTTTTTTEPEAPPTPSAEELALAQSIVDVLNAENREDRQAWADLWVEPMVMSFEQNSGFFGDLLVGNPGAKILGEEHTLGECSKAEPAGRVTCEVDVVNLITDTFGMDPYTETWSYTVAGGKLSDVRWNDRAFKGDYNRRLLLFQAWLDDAHPEIGEIVAGDGAPEDFVPTISDEVKAQLPELIAEYAASLG